MCYQTSAPVIKMDLIRDVFTKGFFNKDTDCLTPQSHGNNDGSFGRLTDREYLLMIGGHGNGKQDQPDLIAETNSGCR